MRKFIFLALAAFFVGCGSGASNVAYENKVEVNNPQLYKKVFIVNQKSRFYNSLLEVALTVKNNTDEPQKMQYRFVWFDKDGFLLYKEPWQRLYLNPKETKQITSIASDARAYDFKFEMKEEQ